MGEEIQAKQEELTAEKPPQKSIAKNSVFYLIYNVLNVIFPFVTGIYVARVLLSSDIGDVAYAQNIAQYFVILAFLGIPTYGMREISKARNDKDELNKLHSELFFLNLISTVIFSGVYLILIFSVGAFREHIWLYLITGISIALNAINNSWLYDGLEEFKFTSIRNIIFKAASFILLVALVRGEGDYYWYAAITVVGTAGNSILNIICTHRHVKFRIKGLNLKRHLKPILFLVVVNLAIEIYTLIDTTMIGLLCPSENVAYYSYGSKINKIFLQVINTFTMVIVPRLAFYCKEKRMDEFNALLTNTLKIIILLAVPIIVGIQFVARFFICKVYGDEYLNSFYVLQILSALLLISPIGYLLGSRVVLSVEKEWQMLVCVGSGAVVNVIANYFLIRELNEYGAAIASVISEIVVMVMYLCFSKRYFHLNKFMDTVWKTIVSAAVMGGYLFGCSYIPLNGWAVFAIQVVGAITIYFLMLLLLREKMLMQVIHIIKEKRNARKKNKEEIIMQELTLEEIQQNSFQVLLKFKEICDENNLQYFLAYGTLLGAIRHKGFIPWDDDIDVWMPRPDYERFIKLCIENDLTPFCLKHYKTCKEYIYPIARLVDTRFKVDYNDTKEYGLGLFIDIYPLDGMVATDKKHRKKSNRLMRKIGMMGMKNYIPSPNKLKNIVKYPYFIFKKIFNRNSNKLIAKADKLAQKYDYSQSETVGCAVWDIEWKIVPKNDFADAVDVEFNGCTFKAPIGYDNLLRKSYRDYMQLPPENERIAHHDYKAYKKDNSER